MNWRTQASSPAAGLHGRSWDKFATAFLARVSDDSMYCSASSDEIDKVDALLSNPSTVSSLGNACPGLVVSPNKSRTVLLYSVRVRRRIGAGPELGIVEHPAVPELSLGL